MKKLTGVAIKSLKIVLGLFLLLTIIVLLYMRHPLFGEKPSGKRLELIKQSPHYKDGQFQNIHHTPQLSEGYNMSGVLYDFMFKKRVRLRPIDALPSVKTDLSAIQPDQDVLIWFGHSSYYIQTGGKRFLADPVFSGSASPLPVGTKAFKGADIYSIDDFPVIDYLFISHDHYDHLDYKTMVALKDKVGKVICGLGVGAHLERWGYTPAQIIETDWWQDVELGEGFSAHTAPTRHFSGRSLSRNNTLWQSYILQTPSLKIYIGGDSGYDTHFAEIGKKFGPIDFAILENGQYDLAWKYIHMQPEEVLQAAKDLNAKRLLPVHSSKFTLGNHPWDEPLKRLKAIADMPLATPMIGQIVDLRNDQQVFQDWWTGVN
ncbi:MBL fold metallo-hydrolase [Chitinophaga sp. B61]|uniref:MBL fold metallo-hydrolase n=2 Tax=Chitinophaga rhizophila TaxID=2866212 RepID=A0ABS7GKV0_9BACT|nr:MBL fold metallo-hydrolase [Chitinophaga rhizophila]